MAREDLIIGINAEKARQGARVWKQAQDSVQSEAKQTDRSVTKTEKTVKKFGNTTERAGKKARTASDSIKRLSRQFLGFTAALAGIRALATFEETMLRIKAVTGATGDEFDSLREKAREMGATTRFSATQAGQGLLFLAKAGFSSRDAMLALEPALNLALAGGIELGQAADILSNVMAQFSIEAGEAARVADVLTAVSQKANVSIVQLSESFKLAGPIAGALKLSLEESAAALGVLGNAGIQASMAGTALRGSLLTLLTPSDSIKQKFLDAGVSAEAFAKTQQDLVSIFRELKAGTLDVSVFVETFAKRFAAAGITITDNVEKLEELVRVANDAEGAAKAFGETIDDSLIGSFKGLISAITELLLVQGDRGLLGSMRLVVDVAADIVRIFAGVETKSESLTVVTHTLTLAIEVLIARWVALKVIGVVEFFLAAAAAQNIAAVAVAKQAATAAVAARANAALATGMVSVGASARAATFAIGGTATATRAATLSIVGLKTAIVSTGIGILIVGIGELAAALLRMGRAADEARGKVIDSIKDASALLKTLAADEQSPLERRLERELNAVRALERVTQQAQKLSEEGARFAPRELVNLAIGQGARDLGGQGDVGMETLFRMDKIQQAIREITEKRREEVASLQKQIAAEKELAKVQGPKVPAGGIPGPEVAGPPRPPDEFFEEQRKAAEDALDARVKAKQALDDFIKSQITHTDLIQIEFERGQQAREIEEVVQEARRLATEAGIALSEAAIKEIGRQIAKEHDLRDAIAARRVAQSAEATIKQDIELLFIQNGLIDAQGQARRDLLITQELIALGFTKEIAASEEILALLRKRLDLEGLVAAKQKEHAEASRTEQELQNALINAGIDLIQSLGDSTKSASDRIRQLSQEISRIVLRAVLTEAFGSADGNVFSGGSPVVGFQNGGLPFGNSVIDRPIDFKLPDGRNARAGEGNKEEGIFPLKRNSQGQLGVIDSGGGRGGGTVIHQDNRKVTMQMRFEGVKDSKSFQSTQTQIVRKMNERLGRE